MPKILEDGETLKVNMIAMDGVQRAMREAARDEYIAYLNDAWRTPATPATPPPQAPEQAYAEYVSHLQNAWRHPR